MSAGEWTREDHDARTDRLRPLADHLSRGHDVPDDERRYRDTWLHIALLADEWFEALTVEALALANELEDPRVQRPGMQRRRLWAARLRRAVPGRP